MKKTLARIRFKKHFGQANHYLITSLIALQSLNESTITEAPDELRMAWSPKDKKASIHRSRIFILQSFLGWAVDSIDMYLSLLNRKPSYLQNQELKSQIDGAGNSVLRKTQLYSNHYKIQPAIQALVDVLITWRNNVFHQLADNRIKRDSRESLISNEAYIAANFRGLDVSQLPDKAEKGDILTFKETASLINAVHFYVEAVDAAVIKQFRPIDFCVEAIQDAIDDKDQKEGFAAKYFSLTTEKRHRFLSNWLMNNYGFSEVDDLVLLSCEKLSKTSIS